MLKTLTISAATVSLLALGACTSTGNVERNALGGAALGAAVGAGVGAISGDVGVGEGAAIGAGVGAAGGAYKGYRDDRDQDLRNGGYDNSSYKLDKATRYYDQGTGRYYYREVGTQRTFYENGERRS